MSCQERTRDTTGAGDTCRHRLTATVPPEREKRLRIVRHQGDASKTPVRCPTFPLEWQKRQGPLGAGPGAAAHQGTSWNGHSGRQPAASKKVKRTPPRPWGAPREGRSGSSRPRRQPHPDVPRAALVTAPPGNGLRQAACGRTHCDSRHSSRPAAPAEATGTRHSRRWAGSHPASRPPSRRVGLWELQTDPGYTVAPWCGLGGQKGQGHRGLCQSRGDSVTLGGADRSPEVQPNPIVHSMCSLSYTNYMAIKLFGNAARETAWGQ